MGNLDIILEVWNPQGQLLYQSEKAADDEYSTTAKGPGDYKVCLDNTYLGLFLGAPNAFPITFPIAAFPRSHPRT